MTAEQIRIAVAECCGWYQLQEPVGSANAFAWWKGNDRYPPYLMPVPNYPASLDACAEFEATLTDDEAFLYNGWLMTPGRYTWQATATQRCLAFLRVRRPELSPPQQRSNDQTQQPPGTGTKDDE